MKATLLKSLFAGTLLLASAVQAHTISIGSHNAGSPGSVTLWLGTYSSGHGTVTNEGSMTLNGNTSAFNQFTTTKPTGLVDGSNNFFGTGTIFGNTNTGSYTSVTNTTGRSEIYWQGVTFTGLSAGTYSYDITGMNTVNWSDYSSSTNNWSGSLTIPGSSIGVVPEPSIIALMGLGLLGMGFARRKMAK